MESILVKIKAENTIDSFFTYGKELNKLIKNEFEINEFINSGFFGQKNSKFNFQRGKYYYFRLVFLKSEEEKKFAKKLFIQIITKKVLSLKNLRFKFEEIIYKESKWSFSYKKESIYDGSIKINLHSPILLKFGSEYLKNIDKKMFFKKALNNYSKLVDNTIDKTCIYENLNQIDFESKTYLNEVKYNNYRLKGLKGEIVLKNNSEDDNFIREYSKLLESIRFLGIGDKVEEGFGQILIEVLN